MVKEIKVGIFLAIGAGLLVTTVLILGDFHMSPRYDIHMTFDSISGVPIRSQIRQNGVAIGSVYDIQLKHNKVIVSAKIFSSFILHQGATARVISTGIIGSKLIEITDGPLSSEIIKDGSYVEGKTSIAIDKMIDDFSTKMEEMFGGSSGEGMPGSFTKLNRVLDNLTSVTGKLDRIMGKDGEDIRAVIAGAKDAMAGIRKAAESLTSVVDENKAGVKAALEQISRVSKNLNAAAEDMKKITEKINAGEGMAGKLISDPEMAENLKETVLKVKEATAEANKILKRAGKVGTDWYYSADFDTADSGLRSVAGITLSPSENKFYSLRVENVSSEKPTKYEAGDSSNRSYNSVTVVLGKKIKNASFYAGAIRSSGGFGFSYSPLKNKKLDLYTEAFRFDRAVNGKNLAWVNAGMKIHFTDWLSLKIIKEDLLRQGPGVSAGVAVDIKDEDLAYLFGFGWLYAAGK